MRRVTVSKKKGDVGRGRTRVTSAAVVAGIPAMLTAASATRLVVRKSGIWDTHKQVSSSRVLDTSAHRIIKKLTDKANSDGRNS